MKIFKLYQISSRFGRLSPLVKKDRDIFSVQLHTKNFDLHLNTTHLFIRIMPN